MLRGTGDERPMLAHIESGYDRSVAAHRGAMTAVHRGGDYKPLSSFWISSRSNFWTLLLAT